MKNYPIGKNKIKDETRKNNTLQSDGWCSNKDFIDLYEKEIRRSYRTDLPLTLFTINIEAVSTAKGNQQDTIYSDLLNNLILIVTSSLREEDITHLDENNLFNILLINTSLAEANIVKKKIVDQLIAYYRLSIDEDLTNILKKIEFNLMPLNIEQEMVN